MLSRFCALLFILAALVTFQPGWVRPEWTELGSWVAASPPEEAFAAVLRVVAIALVSIQLVGLGLAGLGTAVGSGIAVRIGRRLVVPALRTMIPLAVAAGPALAAVATVDPGVIPPAAISTSTSWDRPRSVVVEAGDSMWTIAGVHAPGRVAPYWARVVELNRHRFEDVDLIHPGDVVLLPSGEDADPDTSPPVVDVGVDEDDGLPSSEGEGTGDDGNDDGGSDPGREDVIPPMPGRTVPMLPPLVGG